MMFWAAMSAVSQQRERTEAIDWGTVRERLGKATAATESALRISPERAREILDARARALARVQQPELDAGEVLEVATFALAAERYAVETRFVREVTRLVDCTRVPGTPTFLLGVTNLRGEILSVIDLRRFFDLPVVELSDQARVVVLGGERPEFGVLAESAHEVLSLRRDDLLEPPASVTGLGRESLRGVTRDALIVLDGAALLQDARLFIDEGNDE
jgi:purine-binding chemotaxis protein CheW